MGLATLQPDTRHADAALRHFNFGDGAGTYCAQAYRTNPELMEPGWSDVAARIHGWLQSRDQPI